MNIYHKMIEFFMNIFRESVVDDWQWALVALFANFIFGMRFFVQWLCSERKGKSYIPLSFWLLSLLGSVILIAYAIHIRNFMVLLSVSLAVPIYIRNIQLRRRKCIEKI